MKILIKRGMDVLVASAGLIFLTPLIALTAAVIRCNMGRPILFRQVRPGKNAKPFTLLKFRTMQDQFDASGKLLPDAQRLTNLGKWMRASSLDELPQLWNVLRGDLSLVGPRPLLLQYLQRYSPEQARRHEVKPGITGWAQVNGRNAIRWEEKFRLDVWYVDHWSLWVDIRILWMTLWQALRREGISSADHVTMPEFLGSAGAQNLPSSSASAH